eukprot:509775_1
MPSLYDENSGSTTTATYEASMSGDSISMSIDYSVTAFTHSKYSSFVDDSSTKIRKTIAVETSKWDSEQVIQWIESFAALDDDALWMKLIEQIRQHQVNGNDLLHMNETHLLSQRLAIDSSQIEDTLMHELRQLSIPSLKESSSEEKQSHTPSFHELYLYFDKIDHAKKGQIDYDSFRFVLIEMNPDLEPYKLNNQAIRKCICFKEFDLTNNGLITIEEFIVPISQGTT